MQISSCSFSCSAPNVRCQRRSFVCRQGDSDCLTAPISYSYNFLSFPTKIRIPADLFTMRGPQSHFKRIDFELKLVSARNPRTGASDVTRDFFEMRNPDGRRHAVVVSLNRLIPSAQDIELELNMHIYTTNLNNNGQQDTFYGTAVAKIYLYVTEDPFP